MDSEAPAAPKKKSCFKVLIKYLFSHIGLFILVCLYGVLGAYGFTQLESPLEEQKFHTKQVKTREAEQAVQYLTSKLYLLRSMNNMTEEEWKRKVLNQLRDFRSYITEITIKYNYDGNIDSWHYEWTFTGALLFTFSLISTIGYGHVCPETSTGKVLTIIYSLVGVPLLFLFLANIGESMASSFKYLYSRICCRWCRARRKHHEVSLDGERKHNRLGDEDVGEEDYMPTNIISIPIVLNLLLIAVYMFLGGVLFSIWEDWDITSSIYFTFITLSTIGLGDYVPGKSFEGSEKNLDTALKMLAVVVYILLGMALVSMCISLMQEQIVEKFNWLAHEIGFSEDYENKIEHARPVGGLKGIRRSKARPRKVIKPANSPTHGRASARQPLSRPVSVAHQPQGRTQSAIPGTPLD